jgi:hypothetical protein
MRVLPKRPRETAHRTRLTSSLSQGPLAMRAAQCQLAEPRPQEAVMLTLSLRQTLAYAPFLLPAKRAIPKVGSTGFLPSTIPAINSPTAGPCL